MKRLSAISILVILSMLFTACSLLGVTPTAIPVPRDTIMPTSAPESLVVETVLPVEGMPEGTSGFPWWNDSVFYEIFVRSFYDSDGDGIGDLQGIIQKLDYLNDGDPATTDDLGVTGLWLMPTFPSPAYHGYSVTDFYAVDPEYGTLDDLKALLEAAHARGMRIILDITLNHTSDQHPWFQQARDPASPYHSWYVWSRTDPGYKGPWGQTVWFPYGGAYFYSLFSEFMPDLNYENPEVVEEMQNVVHFWLDEVGVDGFRLDAAKHIIEEGMIQANSDSTHAWWEDFRTFYKGIAPQAFTVGEIWDDTPVMAEYLEGDEFDLSFEFYLAALMIQAINEEDVSIATDRLAIVNDLIQPYYYGVFLTNHDQERVMTQFLDSMEKARVAASMMLTLPGVPFIYYGEEVGMQGEKPDEQIRRPMQWSDGAYGGFSTVTPWEPLGPGWKRDNVELETGDPASLLSHYRDLIRVRSQHAALRVGELFVVNTYSDSIYSILRVHEAEVILVLVNLGPEPISDYALVLDGSSLAEGTYEPVAILGEAEGRSLEVSEGGEFAFYLPLKEIPAFSTFILQLHLVEP